METNNNMQELEQMRSQLNILKNKLDKQEIVNEKLIRGSMKTKMSWINKYRWLSLLAVPFIALCFLPMTIEMNAWGLYGFTMLMVTASVIADFIINRMPEGAFMNDNLLDLSEKMLKMKKYRRIQTIIGLVTVAFWLAWLLYDIYAVGAASDDPDMMKYTFGFMIAVGIGAIIGLVIGLVIFFKMQRTNDRIIDEINELRAEE